MNKPLLLLCLVSLSMVSGCNRNPEPQANSAQSNSQQQTESTSTPQADNVPVSEPEPTVDDISQLEQNYVNEGEEQLEVEPNLSESNSHYAYVGEENLEVSKYTQPIPYGSASMTYVVITSLSDDVTIQSVQVNRGNCRAGYQHEKPNLHYGSQFKAYILGCNAEQIREVMVETARDTYTFNF